MNLLIQLFLISIIIIKLNCKMIRYPPTSLCSSFLGFTEYDDDKDLCQINCGIKNTYKITNSSKSYCTHNIKTIKINNNKATALFDSIIKKHYYINGKIISNISYVKKNEIFDFDTEVIEVSSTEYKQDWYTRFIPKPLKIQDPNKLSVIFLLFDGGSRYVLKRQLPKTVSTLRRISKKHSYYDMLRYHVLGRNSPFNYPALLMCINKNDTFVTKERKNLFDDLKESKYMFIHADGTCLVDMHYYSRVLKNFTGADHSITKISCDIIYNEKQYLSYPRCAGHQELHKHYFDFIKEAVTYYSKKNQPSFSFATFMDSHDPFLKSTPRLDKDLSLFIEELDKNDVFKNTILILYGDHGLHYGSFYKSEFGYLDHKLPLLNIVL